MASLLSLAKLARLRPNDVKLLNACASPREAADLSSTWSLRSSSTCRTPGATTPLLGVLQEPAPRLPSSPSCRRGALCCASTFEGTGTNLAPLLWSGLFVEPLAVANVESLSGDLEARPEVEEPPATSGSFSCALTNASKRSTASCISSRLFNKISSCIMMPVRGPVLSRDTQRPLPVGPSASLNEFLCCLPTSSTSSLP
mmetsp:Transcript_16106/g.41431  ORF Transcript_16106/g.41431 Transcript_16106/m.41431 type:complete len:200 (+) Transcript_16106:239-838(+)